MTYDQETEMERMRRIVDDMGWPCVFIRYNPDAYHQYMKTIRIPKTQRLQKLKDTVIYYATMPGIWKIGQLKQMILHKLYYDS